MVTNNSNLTPINTSDNIMNNILRTIKNGQIQQQIANGVTNPISPDVSPGSLVGLLARAIGNEVSSATSNTQTSLNLQMPDTATGTNLDRWLNIYDIPRRPASSAVGSVIAATQPTSATIFVPAGTQLTSPTGIRYQVLVSGVYGNNSAIQIIAVDTGAVTNQESGIVMQWVSPPAYFSPTAVVSTLNPLTGGVDAESDGIAEQRLLAFFANPPSSGNPSQIIEAAQNADPSVQTAFIYPACRLGSTVDVTVIGYATANDSSRQINSTIVNNKIAPYIKGQLPTSVDCLVTTVTNYPIDVCLFLSLPLASTANPPGPGGGWLDAAPLRTSANKPFIRVVDGYAISGNTSSVPQNTANAFWVDIANYLAFPPINGTQYNFSFVSPTDLTYYTAQSDGNLINASAFGSLASHPSLFYFNFNAPFYDNAILGTVVKPGSVIFPTAVNTQTYVANLLAYLTTLGAGERTASAYLLPRALRQPGEATAYNYKLNARAVKPVLNSGPEVYDGTLGYVGIYTNDGVTPQPNGSGVTDGTNFTVYNTLVGDPAFAANAPPTASIANGGPLGNSYVFIPNNLAFYPL